MATPVLVRFSKKQVEAIDHLVAEGVGESRPEVVRLAVESLDEAICRIRSNLEVEYQRSERGSEEVAALAVKIALAGRERWIWTEDGRCIPEQVAEERRTPIAQCPPRPSMVLDESTDRIRLRFSDKQHEAIDRLVAEEVGVTRPEAIRRAVERLAHVVHRSRCIEEEIAEFERQPPETEAEIAAGFAVARAVIQAEPWVWTEDNELVPKDVAIEEGIPIGTGPPRPRPDWGVHWPGE